MGNTMTEATLLADLKVLVEDGKIDEARKLVERLPGLSHMLYEVLSSMGLVEGESAISAFTGGDNAKRTE